LLPTLALTHTRAVEPLRGFAARVGGSALLSAVFLNIIICSNTHGTIRPNLYTFCLFFSEIYPK
jgi:hypothetical protein